MTAIQNSFAANLGAMLETDLALGTDHVKPLIDAYRADPDREDIGLLAVNLAGRLLRPADAVSFCQQVARATSPTSMVLPIALRQALFHIEGLTDPDLAADEAFDIADLAESANEHKDVAPDDDTYHQILIKALTQACKYAEQVKDHNTAARYGLRLVSYGMTPAISLLGLALIETRGDAIEDNAEAIKTWLAIAGSAPQFSELADLALRRALARADKLEPSFASRRSLDIAKKAGQASSLVIPEALDQALRQADRVESPAVAVTLSLETIAATAPRISGSFTAEALEQALHHADREPNHLEATKLSFRVAERAGLGGVMQGTALEQMLRRAEQAEDHEALQPLLAIAMKTAPSGSDIRTRLAVLHDSRAPANPAASLTRDDVTGLMRKLTPELII